MPIQIGFSSLVCPGWDVQTIISQASAIGYEGIELRGLQGSLHLPHVPELAGQPEKTRDLFADANIDIICLASSATLDSKNKKTVLENKQQIIETIELAARMDVSYVRIFMGEVQKWDNYHLALARITNQLQSLVSVATNKNVTLLLENSGDFVTSEAIWFAVDAISHPSVQACWNQCYALTSLERATNSLPRLGQKLGLIHLCDADYNENGIMTGFKRPGEGMTEIPRQIEILKGMAYSGYVVFEWPAMWFPELESPEKVLPYTYDYIRNLIDQEQALLTAYKGDKRPTVFAKDKTPTTFKS